MAVRARIWSVYLLMRGLRESDLLEHPVEMFRSWFHAAHRVGLCLPESFSLATATPDGRPSGRLLLLKGFGADGFLFYTNYHSRKAAELDANPRAAMTFHWNELFRQVRIEGAVTRATAEQSDAYFNSRGRGSQIGAWASEQSAELPDRKTLVRRRDEYSDRFAAGPVPRPPHWGGYCLTPESFEFWQGRPDRLHDRFAYVRDEERWRITRLSP